MQLFIRWSIVLFVLSAGCISAGSEVDDGSLEVEAAFQAALVDVPCPDEDDDTTAARLAIARVRAIAGLPMPRCDRAAAAAARAHCAYVEANGGALTHVQQKGRDGFTGKTFEDRLAAVSFVDAPAGEVMATITGAASITGPRGYLNSVYHRSFFLRGETTSFGYGATRGCSTIDFGRSRDARTVPRITVVWPPNGARAVPSEFYAANESPNPVPTRSIVGTPISLIRREAFVAVDASIVGPEGKVEATLLTHQNDKNRLVRQGEAHLIPLSPLARNTEYRARFSVTEAGRAAPLVVETTFTTN